MVTGLRLVSVRERNRPSSSIAHCSTVFVGI
jgi:hypothetical protein